MSAPASIPYAFPDVPGLTLEPMTAAHLDAAAALLVEMQCAGTCGAEWAGPAGHARDVLARSLAEADTWCLAWTFQGRTFQYQGQTVQYEILRVDAGGRLATIDLTLRSTHERPGWFWREAARPVLEALITAGIERVAFWTGDVGVRAHRAPFCQASFGAVETDDFARGGSGRLEFPVDLARCTGWPARKTLGTGWALTHGRTTVREASEADLPVVRARLDEVWRGRPDRRDLTGRMLEEWWILDRATLLLGTVDGQLRDARLVRQRAASTAGVGMLLPAEEDAEQDAIVVATARWMVAAGYQTATMFIPNSNLASLAARSGA